MATVSMYINTHHKKISKRWKSITEADLDANVDLYPDKISCDDPTLLAQKASQLGFKGTAVQYVNSKTGKPFWVCYSEPSTRINADVDLSKYASRRK